MGIIFLLGLMGMSRFGIAAHWCAIAYVTVTFVARMMLGVEVAAAMVVSIVLFAVAYFWFRLLEAVEDTVFAYLCVAAAGVIALGML